MLIATGALTGAKAVGAASLNTPSDPAMTSLKFIVTGGHPGDPEYGCGGTIARLTSLGHRVTLLYLNDGGWQTISAATRISEARKACAILGANAMYADQVNGNAVVDNAQYQKFRKLIEAENPDALFTHWPIDNHPDHRAIANLAYEAWKQMNQKFSLYYYEVSDGDDTNQFPAPTHYVEITAVADKKRAACYAHASQNPDYFFALQDTVAQFRGLQCRKKRAEVFLLQLGSATDALRSLQLEPAP
jgi:LmbE family N-acetylglucosaminyl deacetylase